MRPQRDLSKKRAALGRIGFFVGAGAVVVLVMGLVVALAAGPSGDAVKSPDKLALEARQSQQSQQNALRPHAPKTDPNGNVLITKSCPAPAPTVGIIQSPQAPPMAGQVSSEAYLISSDGRWLNVYSGSSLSDSQQGIITVTEISKDPCASGFAPTPSTRYNTPSRRGSISLTGQAGDALSFQYPDGSQGQFNAATGTFVP